MDGGLRVLAFLLSVFLDKQSNVSHQEKFGYYSVIGDAVLVCDLLLALMPALRTCRGVALQQLFGVTMLKLPGPQLANPGGPIIFLVSILCASLLDQQMPLLILSL